MFGDFRWFSVIFEDGDFRWVVLWSSCGRLKPSCVSSCGRVGLSCGRLGAVLSRLGDRLAAVLGCLVVVLGPS